jgi:hypothetical protein
MMAMEYFLRSIRNFLHSISFFRLSECLRSCPCFDVSRFSYHYKQNGVSGKNHDFQKKSRLRILFPSAWQNNVICRVSCVRTKIYIGVCNPNTGTAINGGRCVTMERNARPKFQCTLYSQNAKHIVYSHDPLASLFAGIRRVRRK